MKANLQLYVSIDLKNYTHNMKDDTSPEMLWPQSVHVTEQNNKYFV